MKEHVDSRGTIFEVVTKEQVVAVNAQAKDCLSELLEVLKKHNCRIEERACGEERILVPLNSKGYPYVQEEDSEGRKYCVEIALDGHMFMDAINAAYEASKGK